MNPDVLPFTLEAFLAASERHNLPIWPLHVVAYLLGLAAVTLAIRRVGPTDRLIACILAPLAYGMVEDLDPIVAGLLVTGLLAWRDRRAGAAQRAGLRPRRA